MTLKQALALVTFLTSITIQANAAFIQIDGDLSDWGLHRSGNDTDWTPISFVPAFQYQVEDQTGGSNTFLSPGYGGQTYDAEALYAYRDSTNLYLALVTGLSPDTPNDPKHNSYGPGDFAIDFGLDGSYEFGIETTGKNAGKIYAVSSWNYGLWDDQGNYDPEHPDTLHPTSIKKGTLAGIGELIYTDKPVISMGRYENDKHYIIEAALPLIAFEGMSGKFNVHWTMNCANDAIAVDPQLATVPEPTILTLLALGFLALALLQRNKQLVSLPWCEPPVEKATSKPRFSSAKLLRRDIRNNMLLFKYLHQRKYRPLSPRHRSTA